MPRYLTDDDWHPYVESPKVMAQLAQDVREQLSAPLASSSAPAAGSAGTTIRSVADDVARVPDTLALNGPRSDDPAGWNTRIHFGLLTDGSYGLERITSNGTRQVVTWS
jgi:hypothetical protein